MLVTMFLSMWINNTATTAMMIPIVDSILIEISKSPNLHLTSIEIFLFCLSQNQPTSKFTYRGGIG